MSNNIMHKQIDDIVLFYSNHSKISLQCKKTIDSIGIPIGMIPLDTAESRARAANGDVIQVTKVPSLVVSYVDGTVQLYVDSNKIMAWLRNFLQFLEKQRNSQSKPQKPPAPKKKKRKKKKPIKKRKAQPQEEESSDDGETPIDLVFEEAKKPPVKKNGLSINNTGDDKNIKTNIMDTVAKMKAERQNTLGYNPEQ